MPGTSNTQPALTKMPPKPLLVSIGGRRNERSPRTTQCFLKRFNRAEPNRAEPLTGSIQRTLRVRFSRKTNKNLGFVTLLTKFGHARPQGPWRKQGNQRPTTQSMSGSAVSSAFKLSVAVYWRGGEIIIQKSVLSPWHPTGRRIRGPFRRRTPVNRPILSRARPGDKMLKNNNEITFEWVYEPENRRLKLSP